MSLCIHSFSINDTILGRSKIAMKMSKASARNKEDVTQDEAQSSASEGEDDDMNNGSPREETPDLYRNSALGIYGGVSVVPSSFSRF